MCGAYWLAANTTTVGRTCRKMPLDCGRWDAAARGEDGVLLI